MLPLSTGEMYFEFRTGLVRKRGMRIPNADCAEPELFLIISNTQLTPPYSIKVALATNEKNASCLDLSQIGTLLFAVS